MNQSFERLNQTFAALADPTRRSIIGRLTQGEATVNELVQCFDLTQPTISAHLKVLESSGLISRTRVAQTRPCRLEPNALKAIDAWLDPYRQIWQENYARLDTLLDELKTEPEKNK